MKYYTGLVVAFFLSTVMVTFGQSFEMDLWPNGVPNQHQVIVEENLVVDNEVITHVGRVTKPTLTIYQPAANVVHTGTAVLICPGGGYTRLSIEKEGHAVARYLAQNGIVGVVLKYRLPSDELQPYKKNAPLQDAQQALKMVRQNAAKWNVYPNRVGIMGFSAGGHLAATASSQLINVDDDELLPDFSILIYPVISMKEEITHKGSRVNLLGDQASYELVTLFSNEVQAGKHNPPTFLVHSFDDRAVPIENSFRFAKKLNESGVACEAHFYKSGGHGYGMNPGHTDTWPQLMINWLATLKF